MKTIIAGSRSFSHTDNLLKSAFFMALMNFRITEIANGCAVGPDTMGAEYGEYNNVPVKRFPAEWGTYGNQAGLIRNKEMAEWAEHGIYLWDGKSTGTAHCITCMRNLGKKVTVYKPRIELDIIEYE